MQRLSISLRVLAILGVILHAGMLVWHNSAMLGAKLQGDALTMALGEICYGAATQKIANPGDIPQAPPPGNEQGSCPVCMGCVSAVAILAPFPLVTHRFDETSARIEVVGTTISQRLVRLRPPTRGPPLTV